jgi:hypothetical protein
LAIAERVTFIKSSDYRKSYANNIPQNIPLLVAFQSLSIATNATCASIIIKKTWRAYKNLLSIDSMLSFSNREYRKYLAKALGQSAPAAIILGVLLVASVVYVLYWVSKDYGTQKSTNVPV